MRRLSRLLVGASLIALAGVGCAHTSTAAAKEDKATEKVVVTGSHIPRRVDLRSGLPATISPMRVYTRQQLNDTGRPYDPQAALRALDPSF
jgi:hypothetical protein